MILDLLNDESQERDYSFTSLFSKVNFIHIDPKRPAEGQVSQIEDGLTQFSLHHMLIYSKKYNLLGTVLSRKYVNSAKICNGPLKLVDTTILPDHLSSLPNKKFRNRILFLTPNCDEAYLSAVLLHKLIGDEVSSILSPTSKERKTG